jgi:hypothetical protein
LGAPLVLNDIGVAGGVRSGIIWPMLTEVLRNSGGVEGLVLGVGVGRSCLREGLGAGHERWPLQVLVQEKGTRGGSTGRSHGMGWSRKGSWVFPDERHGFFFEQPNKAINR